MHSIMLMLQGKEDVSYLHPAALLSPLQVPSGGDFSLCTKTVKMNQHLPSFAVHGAYGYSEFSPLWSESERLLTFANAVHPTPMMKVGLCPFKSGMVVDADECTRAVPADHTPGL